MKKFLLAAALATGLMGMAAVGTAQATPLSSATQVAPAAGEGLISEARMERRRYMKRGYGMRHHRHGMRHHDRGRHMGMKNHRGMHDNRRMNRM